MDIKYTLAFICLFHLLLFSIVLWSKKSNRKANRVLAILMLCFAGGHLNNILILSHLIVKFHFLKDLAFVMIFLIGPLYLQYVSCITDIKINWKKYFYLHLIPFVPVLLYVMSFFFKTSDEINTYYENAIIQQPLDATVITSLAAIQIGFYLIWSIRLINRYANYLKSENNTESQSLKWLKTITIILVVVTFIISPFLIAFANNDNNAIYIYYPVMTMLIYGTIFYKSINFPDAEAEKKRIREHLREKISRDMHDDLGSGLSKISFVSNSLKEQLQHDKNSMEQVEKISQTSKDLVNNMSHIIWAVNSENQSLNSLLAYIREYAVGFLDDCGLQCHINFPETAFLNNLLPEQRRNIFLVLKESLNNIARHASATQVRIDVLIHKEELSIIIKDDGKGFLTDNRHSGNGLKNMQYRMEQTGGKYKIESHIGNGTCTTISLIMK